MKKLLLALGLIVLSGSAQAAFAQTLLPATRSQYPAPTAALTNSDCLLGVRDFSEPQLPHTRCMTLQELAQFFSSGSSGIGIAPGSANQIAFYAGSGQALSGVPTSPINNAVLVTNASGLPLESNILPAALNIPNAIVTPQIVTQATLPAVTSANEGEWAEVSDCRNGTEGPGAGTGCWARVNNQGTWVLLPNPTNATITVAGQTINLVNGATVAGAGVGSLVATTDGSGISGHVPQFNSAGTLVDSGSGPGGGGGSGTIAAGTTNQVPYWAANGTTLSPLTVVNNAVLITSSGGVPSEATTLPANLTIPSPTCSNCGLTGTSTYTVLNGSGKLTTAASATGGAGINVPSGTAPTSPTNGDIWQASNVFLGRLNGATLGFAMTTNGGALSVSAPITLSAGGAFACATCAVLPTGGTLTASAPLAISATGAMTIGTAGALEIPRAAIYYFDPQTVVQNQTYQFVPKFPWASGHLLSVDVKTNGTGTPSYSLAVNVNGSAVTGCSAITVNPTGGSTTCTSTAITTGQPTTLTVSGVNGAPSDSFIEVHYTSTIL